MAQPTIVRGPTPQGAIAANEQIRFNLSLGSPYRALHYFATDGGVALTEAQGEADIAMFHVEMNGVKIWEATPAEMNDLHRYYQQALGGNVTDDGRYTIAPHRRHLIDELLLVPEVGLGRNGRQNLEWGTGDLESLVLVITAAGSVSNWDGGRLYLEYDADPLRQGELPGQIYRLRRQPQSGLATSWQTLTSLWRKEIAFQKLLAVHIKLNSAVVDVNEGISIKINKHPRFYAPPSIFARWNLDRKRTNISGYHHIDFQDSGELSACPDLGKLAGVVDVLAEANYSTAPSGGANTLLIEDAVQWSEIKAA